MQFTKLPWPATLDRSLVTWTPGNRRPSRHCALCGAPIGDEDGCFLLWRENGDGARFCDACTERHWGMSIAPEVLATAASKTQPGIGEGALERWNHPGHCPDCGADNLTLGPRGGIAVNRQCRNCGQWWNTVWRHSVGLGLIERIRPLGAQADEMDAGA